jgi:hypothetical protein
MSPTLTRRRTQHVLIDGIQTDVEAITVTHDVDTPIATGSITVRTPRPDHIQLGRPVRIDAGYDGQVFPIFRGHTQDDQANYDDGGSTLRVEIVGWANKLWYPQPTERKILGSVSLKDIFNAFCAAYGVPWYHADDTLMPNGANVFFGGVPEIDDAYVVVKAGDKAGDVISRWARLYGYRLYDQPNGTIRLKKISGLPVGTPVANYVQGENVLSVGQRRTLDGVANMWEVYGAKYVAADNTDKVIKSIPASYINDYRMGPFGVTVGRISDPAIVHDIRADWVRNVAEIDRSLPIFRWSWQTTGEPERMPGEVVTVTSPTVGGQQTPVWLMRVSHSITDRGWTTSMEGWAGSGTAQPAGNDCTYQTLVGNGGFHLGNEYLWHYRRPNPDGLTKDIPFTVPADYSTLAARGYAHGTNSFMQTTGSTASRFEIWQTVDGTYKSVASGELPSLAENLSKRLNYSIDSTWDTFAIPLRGSLKAGSAVLKIISGRDSAVGDYDDFEVRDLTLETCGVGTPAVIL